MPAANCFLCKIRIRSRPSSAIDEMRKAPLFDVHSWHGLTAPSPIVGTRVVAVPRYAIHLIPVDPCVPSYAPNRCLVIGLFNSMCAASGRTRHSGKKSRRKHAQHNSFGEWKKYGGTYPSNGVLAVDILGILHDVNNDKNYYIHESDERMIFLVNKNTKRPAPNSEAPG